MWRIVPIYMLFGWIVGCNETPRPTAPDQASEEELSHWVECLDTVNSVYDPLVEKIAEFGEPVVPLLIEKLNHPRHITALAAAWVFRRMGKEETLPQLLSAYDTTGSRFALMAIGMILEDHPEFCRKSLEGEVDLDKQVMFQEMLEWVVLEEPPPGMEEGWTFPDCDLYRALGDSVVIVAQRELGKGYRFSLPNKKVYILDDEEMQEWADEHGDYLYFRMRDMRIYDRSKEMAPLALFWFEMPWKVSRFSKHMYLSGGGVQSLWRKHEGRWRFLTILVGWIS